MGLLKQESTQLLYHVPLKFVLQARYGKTCIMMVFKIHMYVLFLNIQLDTRFIFQSYR